jgi:hypothetical protein
VQVRREPEEECVPSTRVLPTPLPGQRSPAGRRLHDRPLHLPLDTAPLSPVLTDGRHLSVDGAPWRLRAVTYGSFLPRSGDGAAFPEPARVRGDLETAAAAGFNTVRTYTLPPADLLDAAEEMGLRLLIGLHYDDWRMVDGTSRLASAAVRDSGRRAVDEACRAGRRRCVAAVGGRQRGARRPVRRARARRSRPCWPTWWRASTTAPRLLATYAELPHDGVPAGRGPGPGLRQRLPARPGRLRGYLQHLSVGTDLRWWCPSSASDAPAAGPQRQGRAARGSSTSVDEVGCAGAAVFSLTDEWGVGGYPVEGWQFGLQDQLRSRGRPSPSPPTGRSGRCASCGPPGRG